MRLTTFFALLSILLSCSVVWADAPVAKAKSSTATTPAEAELGKKTAEQIEKDVTLIKDEKAIAKLNAMAADIAPFTERPDVVYTCKILDVDEINAMAIPGGIIYFTRGLLNAAESDDELAGVMAHEIAHNALYHSKKMIEKERKQSLINIAGLIPLIYASGSTKADSQVSPIDLIIVGEMVKQALVNGYSVDLEKEADTSGAHYLQQTKKYSPVGLYSVILGFRQMENSHAKVELGYLRTHPDPDERLEYLKKEFTKLHMPINLWSVVNFRASALPPEKDQTGYAVQLGSSKLITFTAGYGKQDAQARANAAVKAINSRLTRRDTDVQSFDVQAVINPDGKEAYIRLRNTTVMTLIPEDLQTTDLTSLQALASMIKVSIQTAMQSERVKRGW